MSEKIVQTAGRAQLGDFAPMFEHLNDDVLFGEVWNEDAIDVKSKCRIFDGIRHHGFLFDLSPAECKDARCEQRRDCSDHHAFHNVCRMAEGLGSIPSGKGSMERESFGAFRNG